MDEVKWGSTNRGMRECGAGFLFGCLSLLLTSSIHLQVERAVAFCDAAVAPRHIQR